MNGRELAKYCLAKKGAYADFPFSDTAYLTVKIRTSERRNGCIFAEIFEKDGEEKFTFSTSAEDAEFIREQFGGAIVRGWHCPPVQAKYKSTATLSLVDDADIKKFADVSYARAVASLTSKEREKLGID